MIVEDEESEGLEPCFDATTIHIGEGFFLLNTKMALKK
jgi:hypothetical protein